MLLEDIPAPPAAGDARASALLLLETPRAERITATAVSVAANDWLTLPDGTRARVPRPLGRYVTGVDAAAWRWRGRSIATLPLPGLAGGDADLLLIRAGSAVPVHTHRGTERTLVLQGSFHDGTGEFARGDCAVADGSVEHRPVASDIGDCLCLAVTDAPLHFTGPVGRILNFWAGK